MQWNIFQESNFKISDLQKKKAEFDLRLLSARNQMNSFDKRNNEILTEFKKDLDRLKKIEMELNEMVGRIQS